MSERGIGRRAFIQGAGLAAFQEKMQRSISGKKLESTKLISGRPPGGLREHYNLTICIDINKEHHRRR
jgi:hypothetical protein